MLVVSAEFNAPNLRLFKEKGNRNLFNTKGLRRNSLSILRFEEQKLFINKTDENIKIQAHDKLENT